jgi:hypothetical protein
MAGVKPTNPTELRKKIRALGSIIAARHIFHPFLPTEFNYQKREWPALFCQLSHERTTSRQRPPTSVPTNEPCRYLSTIPADRTTILVRPH